MFAILDKKTGANGILPAFDMNACRRNLKKQNNWSRIPKKISVREMGQAEVEALIRSWQQSQVTVEDGTPVENDVPLVDPLNNFQEIDAAQERLDAIEGELAEVTPEPVSPAPEA
jgi:hypothetical protein